MQMNFIPMKSAFRHGSLWVSFWFYFHTTSLNFMVFFSATSYLPFLEAPFWSLLPLDFEISAGSDLLRRSIGCGIYSFWLRALFSPVVSMKNDKTKIWHFNYYNFFTFSELIFHNNFFSNIRILQIDFYLSIYYVDLLSCPCSSFLLFLPEEKILWEMTWLKFCVRMTWSIEWLEAQNACDLNEILKPIERMRYQKVDRHQSRSKKLHLCHCVSRIKKWNLIENENRLRM